MSSKSNKVRAGVFVVGAIALLAFVVIVFGGMKFWEKEDRYTILFDDSVMGLDKGAYVYVEGIRVGRVGDIALAPGGVSVEIVVKNGTPVTEATTAKLQYAGITGLKVIDLEAGDPSAPRLAEGSRIPQGETVLDKLEKRATDLAEQSTQLVEKANKIVDNVVAITDPEQFAAMSEIMANTKQISANLSVATGALGSMITENRAAVKSSLGALDGLFARLDDIMRSNEGPLRSAVYDLRQASRNFKELSRDVRQKPSRLLYSPSPSERKLP